MEPLSARFRKLAGLICGRIVEYRCVGHIAFYEALMADLRDAIAHGRLTAFADDFRALYAAGKGETR